MPRSAKSPRSRPAAKAAVLKVAPERRQRSEAFETLARDLLTFAGHFERSSTKRVATGGVGKKTTQRIAPFLRRSDEEYASFLGVFLIDRRVLFEGEDRWEISRPNLMRLWQPERLLRSVYHFWLRTPLWNESLADPDVLSLVRREYVSADPSLEARRRRLCEELLGTPAASRSSSAPCSLDSIAAFKRAAAALKTPAWRVTAAESRRRRCCGEC